MKKRATLLSTGVIGAVTLFGTAAFVDAEVPVQTTPYVCNGAVDKDGLNIEIRSANTDAMEINQNCTGSIRNVKIHTWTNDGIKVKARTPVAHDLVIENVEIICEDVQDGAHQDGVQAMAGKNITFKNLKVRCGLSNAQFFISSEAAVNVVCEDCNLGEGASHTANVWGATNGLRNSLLCKPETQRYYTKHGAAVDVNNERALAGDSRCS